MRTKLLMDEHVQSAVTSGLRLFGFDIVTAQEVGLTSQDDDIVLAYAAEHNRAVFTVNRRDFVMLHNQYILAGRTHSGILVMKYCDIRETIRRIRVFAAHHQFDDVSNQLCYL
ncbi:MAG: hypothetical protein EAZ92_02610 [Candidatus Kapaibacterium sp.]|nr:MAG: hypothetical protein EAZ92_02610 [Candidatus Kapabacteria bacterium]